MIPSRPSTLYGMDVIVTPDHPKMQLSERVCEILAPDFIKDMNTWMLGFFGMTNAVKDGETLVSQTAGRLFMNPRTYQNLRASLSTPKEP
jgi:hypothetical protein